VQQAVLVVDQLLARPHTCLQGPFVLADPALAKVELLEVLQEHVHLDLGASLEPL